jgi:uncharacterized repeat protein (TIGR03833 family)
MILQSQRESAGFFYLYICINGSLLKFHKGVDSMMDGTIRSDVKKGLHVMIVLKKDQRTGTLTEGIVKDILTSAPKHHRGIKVRLEDGQIGRVQKIIG